MTLHCIAWHGITLHYIPLHVIASQRIALHRIASHCIALSYITLRVHLHFYTYSYRYVYMYINMTLHCMTLHSTTSPQRMIIINKVPQMKKMYIWGSPLRIIEGYYSEGRRGLIRRLLSKVTTAREDRNFSGSHY